MSRGTRELSTIERVNPAQAVKGLRIKRKVGEKVHVYHQDELLVIQVVATYSGDQVSLAFNADESFSILREELDNDLG